MRTSLKTVLCTIAAFAALTAASGGAAMAQSSSDYTTAPTDWRSRCDKGHACDHTKPVAGTPAACADAASGQSCAGKGDQPK